MHPGIAASERRLRSIKVSRRGGGKKVGRLSTCCSNCNAVGGVGEQRTKKTTTSDVAQGGARIGRVRLLVSRGAQERVDGARIDGIAPGQQAMTCC
jgi:hypothetical protein